MLVLVWCCMTNSLTAPLECSCGAKAPPKDRKRFLARHPKMCSERREFTRQLAQGTRCVDDVQAKKDSDRYILESAERWDSIEKSLKDVMGRIRR